MRFSPRLIAVLLGLTAMLPIQAQEPSSRGRNYVVPSILWSFFDSDRDVHNGPGFQLDVGLPLTPSLALELTAFGSYYGSPEGRLEQRGGLLNGLYTYGRHGRLSRFWLVGAGVMRSDNERVAGSNMVATLGWGTRYHLDGVAALRGGLYYRLESANGRSYDDFALTLGVEIPFGGRRQGGE